MAVAATGRTAFRMVVPDYISNSYFPAIAAAELGFFAREGVAVDVSILAPVERSYAALRDGAVDFVAGSAHSAVSAFPDWRGVKLLCAQAQGTYWFLVMHADLAPRRGDLSVVEGRRIGAAPWVGKVLRCLLEAAGYDLEASGTAIVDIPAAAGATTNFGLTAAEALARREIDGFWANGMAAELAVTGGVGGVVLDVRRGDGPAAAFDFTAATVAATNATIRRHPDAVAAVVRGIAAAQEALRADPELASALGRRLFPPREASLIGELIRRDAPFYDTTLSASFVAGMQGFLSRADASYGFVDFKDIVYLG